MCIASARRIILPALLVGCGTTSLSATGPVDVDVPLPDGMPVTSGAPSGVAPPVARPGPDADATTEPSAACATAFDDQRSLTVDPEVTVHPERQAAFLRVCSSMPPLFQRCASPLYQQDHEEECAAVHDEERTAAKSAWHRTFELLSDDRLDLPPTP